jgi:hypothetical protein
MTKLKYRLIERKNIFNKDKRFFPQVKMTKFFFFGTWQKIGTHGSNGFGLYPETDYKYPKTKKEAEKICANFDKWTSVETNTVNIVHTIKLGFNF